MPASQNTLTAPESVVVARYLAAVTQVFVLDRFWTTEAQDLSETAGADRGSRATALEAVVGELDAGVIALSELADAVAVIVDGHADSARAAVAAGVLDIGSGRLGTMLRAREGDLVEASLAAAARIGTRTGAERELLRTEYERLAGGAGSDGDLTDDQWFDVGLVAAGASVLLGPEAGVVVVAIAGLFDLIFG